MEHQGLAVVRQELMVHQEPPVLLGVAALVALREQAAVVGRVVLMVLLGHIGRFWLMKPSSFMKEHNTRFLPI